MRSEYILVIIVCAALGYWCVSRIIDFLEKRRIRAGGKNKEEEQERSDRGHKANPSDETTWFQVLGIAPTATVDEIKSAYRAKVRQYHPDRVADLGVELRNIADKKMKELNAAYEAGRRAKGMA